MKSAIIEDGVVVNIILGEIEGSVECGDDVAIGWRYEGETFSAPDPAPIDLVGYAAAKRYALENGGFDYKGSPIATDATSQSKIGNGALAATVIGPSFSTAWKCSDGSFISLDHDEMIAMASSIMAFVSACFAAEDAICSEIKSGSVTTTVQVDEYAWPPNSQ